MKRKIAIVLTALSLLLVPATINAEETEMVETEAAETEESATITFRGIPWGTSYTDVYPEIVEYDPSGWSVNGSRVYDMGYILTGNKSTELANNELFYYCPLYEGIEVAGYTTTYTYMYFVYGVDEDGYIDRTENGMKFYAASYIFEPSDFDGMAQDLLEKLSSLYGDPVETVFGEDTDWNDCEFAIWYDDEGNALSLSVSTDADEDDDIITISYVCGESDEWLQEAYDADKAAEKAQEAENYGNGNTSGL